MNMWESGQMDSNPVCGRTFQVPGLPLTQRGECRSDPPITGGMQDQEDLAEGLRWVLSIEEGLCLDDRFPSSVLERVPFFPDESV